MLMDSVGQEFRKIIVEMVYLCSGASASKTQVDGGIQMAGGWNHLEAFLLMCLALQQE